MYLIFEIFLFLSLLFSTGDMVNEIFTTSITSLGSQRSQTFKKHHLSNEIWNNNVSKKQSQAAIDRLGISFVSCLILNCFLKGFALWITLLFRKRLQHIQNWTWSMHNWFWNKFGVHRLWCWGLCGWELRGSQKWTYMQTGVVYFWSGKYKFEFNCFGFKTSFSIPRSATKKLQILSRGMRRDSLVNLRKLVETLCQFLVTPYRNL